MTTRARQQKASAVLVAAALLLPGLLYAAGWSYDTEVFKTEYHLALEMIFDEDGVRLDRVMLREGSVATEDADSRFWTLRVTGPEKQVIHQSSFMNPRVRFFDRIDPSTGELSGGPVVLPSVRKTLKIPVLEKDGEVQIVDRLGAVVFQSTMSELLAQSEQTKSTLTWTTETLIYNGDPDNRIDLVFLGDGYTAGELTTYDNDIATCLSFTFGYEPYDEYASYFNVHKVNVISNESGVDHLEAVPPIYRDTELDAYYGCAGIDRLICADDALVYAAAALVPEYDQIMVLINDPVYGGAGGDYLTSYNGGSMPYVFVHEFGHSVALLADEYLYGDYPGSVSAINCDLSAASPAWQSWIDIGSPGVGTFAGCSYSNYYRPTNNGCMMRILLDHYCVVCREQNIRRMAQLTFAADSIRPDYDPQIRPDEVQVLEVFPLQPETHDLSFQWYRGWSAVPGETLSSYTFAPPDTGVYRIYVVIEDLSDMVLDDPNDHMMDYVQWYVTARYPTAAENATGPELSSRTTLSVFPNPFNPSTTVSCLMKQAGEVDVSVFNLKGQEVRRLLSGQRAAGVHKVMWDGRDSAGHDVASGLYVIAATVEGVRTQTKAVLLK